MLVGRRLAEEQLMRGLPAAVLDGFFACRELWDMLSAKLCCCSRSQHNWWSKLRGGSGSNVFSATLKAAPNAVASLLHAARFSCSHCHVVLMIFVAAAIMSCFCNWIWLFNTYV